MTTDTHTQTDLAGELALVEQQARALGNPLPAVDAIVDDLNRLYDRGADLPTLQAIQANAGALLDADVLLAAAGRNLDPADYLARNDAYRFFEPLGALIKTGPTHTNVCDLRVVVTATLPGRR